MSSTPRVGFTVRYRVANRPLFVHVVITRTVRLVRSEAPTKKMSSLLRFAGAIRTAGGLRAASAAAATSRFVHAHPERRECALGEITSTLPKIHRVNPSRTLSLFCGAHSRNGCCLLGQLECCELCSMLRFYVYAGVRGSACGVVAL